ncbi:sugar-binding protein [Victivallis vadensis]|uniref:Carbohydrate binding protein with CBM9 domain n=1 Tax=Victivallis vadensis TaxID=172901 RepID=A0A2U1ABC7_9BACT|nr:sugar-binding protein [Victivallis vadensis]PVY32029.1 carbohydrate binding protein with CBM9 domain [Victivallis vadensis]
MYRYLICAVLPAAFALSAADVKIEAAEYSFGSPALPLVLRFGAADGLRYTLTLTDTFTGKTAAKQEGPVTAERLPLRLELPYGSYQAKLEVADGSGRKIAEQTRGFRVMTRSCAEYASEAEREYEFRYGVPGGCSDHTAPADSEALGRRWFRFENPNWKHTETASGVYDFTALRRAAERWRPFHVRLNSLQALYHHPAFHDPTDLPGFSRGYGRYLQAMAAAMAGTVDEHELGNEDNGANKNLYTEVGRHGSAGIRSRQPFAVTGNSGTAHIDYGWLERQGARRLFDTVDALAIHPYTNNSTCTEAASPEAFRLDEQFRRLYDLVFRYGGMKELWNTEFGWPNGAAEHERHRTNLYIRMLIFGDAAGMRMQTVYNWDRDYNTVHHAAGVALHQFARRRMGTRFVGLLRDPACDCYTAVYEGSGKAFAIQWTPGEKSFAPTIAGTYSDLFGNPVEQPQISRSVLYIDGIGGDTVRAAAAAHAGEWAERFKAKLKQFPSPRFASFTAIAPTDTAKLRNALLALSGQFHAPISNTDQAHFAFALRWYLAAARYFPAGTAECAFDPAPAEQLVRELNRDGLDLPSVRWLLRTADRIRLERDMAAGNPEYRQECAAELAVLQKAVELFCRHGERVQFAVFTNLYRKSGDKFEERLQFVPTRPTPVQFRVSSYAGKPQRVTVRPLLPAGWKGEAVTVDVPAEGEAWGELILTAPGGTGAKEISVSTEIAGKPARITTFDNLEYIPAVNVSIPLIPRDPEVLPVTFSNQEARPVSGRVKLSPAGVGGAPLALAGFRIGPNASETVKLRLAPDEFRRLAQSGYSLDARLSLDDGRKFEVAGIDVDFGIAVRIPDGFRADGDLSKWNGALPLKLNREEYARGSYGNSYSQNDLSAVTWLGWNEKNLCFAARVTDQVIHQVHTGDAMWTQDSIQLLFAADGSDRIREFIIAQTPQGAVVWDQTAKRTVAEARLFVNYRNGEFIYELALPWESLGGRCRDAVRCGSLRYAIAINDDDVLVSRRYLERFPNTVVNSRRVAAFPEITLSARGPQPVAQEAPAFQEDFAAYPDGTVPEGWLHMHSGYPTGTIRVAAGRGEHGGNALRVANEQPNKPHHFCILTDELKLELGVRYELRVRLRGNDIAGAQVGICSDAYGNQDFRYLKLPENLPEWTTLATEAKGGQTGRRRVVIRAVNRVGELLIDRIEVVRK